MTMCSCWLFLFDDKRLLSALLAVWTIISGVIFVMIMVQDGSNFLICGPNAHNLLFGVALDTWTKWWAVALYTFFSTCIAAFSGDAIWPFLTNVVMDPKTKYIPYSKATCLVIIQVQTIYGNSLLLRLHCETAPDTTYLTNTWSCMQGFASVWSAHSSLYHRYDWSVSRACTFRS